MKTTIKQLPKSKIKLDVELTQEEMGKYFDEAYQELAPSVDIKGFRPGKAPREMVVAQIGESRLTQAALDKALPDSIIKALKEQDMISIAAPAVSIKSYENGLSYEAEVDVWPKAEMGDYTKLKIKLPEEIKVKDEEVEKIVDHLQKQKADFKEVERPAAKGDRVEINFKGQVGGVVLEKLTSLHHPVILGEGALLPAFEENVIGMKAKEDKKFKILMPKDMPDEEIKGKEVEFEVHVDAVQEIILPKIDEKFLKELGQKSVEELKKSIAKSIEAEKETRRHQEIEAAAIEKALTLLKTEVPESLIDQELDRIFHRMEHEAKNFNLTLEQYLLRLKKTQEELRKEWRGQAEKNVRVGLMLGEVVKREKLDKNDEEVTHKAVDILIEHMTD